MCGILVKNEQIFALITGKGGDPIYRIMQSYLMRKILHVRVMDFRNGRIIDFTLDELEKDELDGELKQYIKENLESIHSGKWNYSKFSNK